MNWLFEGGALTLLNANEGSPDFSLGEYSLDSFLWGMHHAFIRSGARPTGELAYRYAEFLDLVERLTQIVTPIEQVRALTGAGAQR
jgi:hypothetical protein